MRLLSEREYISPLSPVCFLLNIQIRERKTTEIAENREMQRREKRRGTKKKEKKKMGQRIGVHEAIARRKWIRAPPPADPPTELAYIGSPMNISRFPAFVSISLCLSVFPEMGYAGLARIPFPFAFVFANRVNVAFMQRCPRATVYRFNLPNRARSNNLRDLRI